MERIVKILMERDDLSEDEAQEQFELAQLDFNERMDAGSANVCLFDLDDFCEEHFGLEPDYLDDFLYPGSGDDES